MEVQASHPRVTVNAPVAESWARASVHRLVLEVPATYFGLRGVGDLTTTYIGSGALLILLYPACPGFRRLKAAHPNAFLKYLSS